MQMRGLSFLPASSIIICLFTLMKAKSCLFGTEAPQLAFVFDQYLDLFFSLC